MAEVGVCAKCGRIRQIYDRRKSVCFQCYLQLSPFAGGERRIIDKTKKIGLIVCVWLAVFAASGCKSIKMVPVADTPLFEVRTRAPISRADNMPYYSGDYDANYYRFHNGKNKTRNDHINANRQGERR